MVQKGRGVLAADESAPTISKRFNAIDVESTEENRRLWRSLLHKTQRSVLRQKVSQVYVSGGGYD